MDTADTIIVVLIVGIILVFGAFLVLNSGAFNMSENVTVENTTTDHGSMSVNNSNTTTHTSTSSSSNSGSSSSSSSNSNPSSSSSSSSSSNEKSSSSTPQAGQAEGTYDPTDFD